MCGTGTRGLASVIAYQSQQRRHHGFRCHILNPFELRWAPSRRQHSYIASPLPLRRSARIFRIASSPARALLVFPDSTCGAAERKCHRHVAARDRLDRLVKRSGMTNQLVSLYWKYRALSLSSAIVFGGESPRCVPCPLIQTHRGQNQILGRLHFQSGKVRSRIAVPVDSPARETILPGRTLLLADIRRCSTVIF